MLECPICGKEMEFLDDDHGNYGYYCVSCGEVIDKHELMERY